MTQTLNDALVTPEVEISKRILELIFLIDISWSMKARRMAVANQAVREIAGELKEAANNHPEIEFRVRCISFSDTARWHIGPDPVQVSSFSWTDLKAGGCTATGAAVNMLAKAAKIADRAIVNM